MNPFAKVYFKDWLPDLPEHDNPGLLEANNVRPINLAFANALGVATASGYTAAGFPQTPWGTFAHYHSNGLTPVAISSTVGATTAQVMRQSAGAWQTAGQIVANTGNFFGRVRKFAQYDEDVYIAGQTLGKLQPDGTLTNVTAAPAAHDVAVVGQFLVGVGVIGSPAAPRVQWSSIGNPDDWPTPGSSTAIARQAGEQDLSWQYGIPMAITGGDEFGVIFQHGAVYRMTYVGGNVVFQFDRISDDIGCTYPTSVIKVKNLTYFATRSGFYVTDGTSIRNISHGKVSKYFLSRLNTGLHYRIQAAADLDNHLIYWPYPTSSATSAAPICTSAMLYNFEEDRWGHQSLNSYGLIEHPLSDNMLVFEGAASLKSLATAGSVGTATLTTGEVEGNLGGYSRVSGIKPLIDATINAVTVSLGVRDHLGDASSYGSATTANASTGFVDFNKEARYHRLKFQISGTFNAAQGYEAKGSVSGQR